MALCSQHQKPVVMPIKQVLQQKQENLRHQKLQNSTRTNNHAAQVFNYSQNLESTSETKVIVHQRTQEIQSKHSQNVEHSPRLGGGGTFEGSQTPFKSPQNMHKRPAQQLNGVHHYVGSPLPTTNKPQQNMFQKGLQQRLSIGGSSSTGVNLTQEQTSVKKQKSNSGSISQHSTRIIHSKVIRNLNNVQPSSTASCLQIDLSSLSAKNTLAKHPTSISEEQTPFLLYGSSGDLLTQLQLSNSGANLHGKREKSIAPSLNAPQPMLIQLNSQSPQASNSQFFAKSPKLSKQSQQQSSNRQSIVNSAQTIQKLNFQQQTQSSLAKSNAVTKQPFQRANTQTEGSNSSKSKSQRAVINKNSYHGAKYTKMPSKFEASAKKDNLFKQINDTSPIKPLTDDRPDTINDTVRVNPVTQIIEVDASQFLAQQEVAIKDITTFVQEQPIVEKQSNEYPMSKACFLEINEGKLGSDDLQQFARELTDDELVYYPGLLNMNEEKQPFEIAEEIKVVSEERVSDEKNELHKKVQEFDDEEGYYKVNIGDHLLYRYEIIKVLGKGSFAQVVACKDHKINQNQENPLVAIKITRNTDLDRKFAQSESKLLQFLMQNDQEDQYNIVRLLDEFSFREHHCFVFELLPGGDLFEHLKESGFSGFQLPIIREYAREILKALVFLEQHQIIHCDLKPENILLLESQGASSKRSQKPKQRLKLVDFGSGSFRGEQAYTYVQSRFYRAPEVILRQLPPPHSYTEKVDIWSLGCILAELFTGEPLFPGNNEQEQLELIMELRGIPPSSLIDRSRKKEHYFDIDYSPFLIEDEEQGILRIPNSRKLESVIMTDDLGFIDFIKKCLELEPELRFSASHAIEHPWIRNQRVAASMECEDNQSDNRSETMQIETEFDNDDCQKPSDSRDSSSQVAFMAATNSIRRRDEEHDGVRGTQFEESPLRDVANDKPKKSLAKHQFSIQAILADEAQKSTAPVRDGEQNDSNTSTPKNEGGIQHNSQHRSEDVLTSRMEVQDVDQVFVEIKDSVVNEDEAFLIPLKQIASQSSSLNISMEKRRDRSTRKKAALDAAAESAKSPMKNSIIVQQSPLNSSTNKQYDTQIRDGQSIQIIGQFEIFREEDDVRQSINSHTSGIASEANIPPVHANPSTMSEIGTSIKQVPQSPVKRTINTDTLSSLSNTGVTGENTINKITITFYQKRNQQQQSSPLKR